MSEIPLHARVALVDGADTVYAHALAGTEGWVREKKQDEHGFDMVRVEWDKEHWRYNNQPDGWTFESHFKIIGEPEPPSETEAEEEREIVHQGPMTLPESPPTDEQMDEYMTMLTEAMEAASEGESFMLIVIRRQPNPDDPEEAMYVPTVFTGATNPEAALLLDVQLMECAAQSYEEAVFALIEKLKNERPS